MTALVVILGAGASHDCSSGSVETRHELQPPLVKDLFASHREFAQIQNHYPLAEAAAAEIRRTLLEGSIPLEEFLRTRLRDSEDRYARLRYRQVPLYLQHLLTTVGALPSEGQPVLPGFTRQPDNYDVLLNETLQLDRVVYITLNYDTILDQRLQTYPGGLADIDAYCTPGRNWGLYKLHGSVDWVRPIRDRLTSTYAGMTTSRYLELLGALDDIELDPSFLVSRGYLESRRYDGDRTLYYPALSAPLGAEDELSCPESHVESLRTELGEIGDLDVLVIGYSGLDKEVLKLVRDNAGGIRSLLVANRSEEASFAAATTFGNLWEGRRITEDSLFPGGFTELVSTGRLR